MNVQGLAGECPEMTPGPGIEETEWPAWSVGVGGLRNENEILSRQKGLLTQNEHKQLDLAYLGPEFGQCHLKVFSIYFVTH